MPVLRSNADHAAKTRFDSRFNTAISAIMAGVYATHSKIGFGLLHFSAPC
jgi:hypothetical protein